VVRRDAGIRSPADLKGKSVGLGSKYSGDYAASLFLLDHFGLDASSIQAEHLSYQAAKQRFSEGTLDAAFITIGTQAPILPELFATGECDLLEIPYAEALTVKYGLISTFRIPKGLYRCQEPVEPADDVLTVAAGAELLTRRGVHSGLVNRVTRLALNEDFVKENGLNELFAGGQQFAREKPGFPIHPGAQRFYAPQLDVSEFEGWEALYSLIVSMVIAAFVGLRWLHNKRARRKEHRLDGYIRSLLLIERRQRALDADEEGKDVERLQGLLDEVSSLRQEALSEFTAYELKEDRAADCFISMCHALSNKINAKLSRQRFDRCIKSLSRALDEFSARQAGETG
jgi:hypothetical protein